MVASSNYEQYTPFTRVAPLEPEGFQSSEEESDILSPIFDQPRTAFLPMGCAFISRSPAEPSQFRSSLLHKDRYQSIASDCLLPHDSLIAPPHNSQYYVQSQGFGAHHHGYPKEPPNTAINYNASVQLRTQSFTSSAYELAMAHCSPLLMNSTLNRFTTSVDIPSSTPHINPSHFHLSHPPTIASAPIPQAPLVSPADTVDPPTSITAVASTDTSIISSSRAGPARNVSSGVIACQQWCVVICPIHKKSRPWTNPKTWAVSLVGHARFGVILLAQSVRIVSSVVMNAYTIKYQSDGGQINGLGHGSAPARSVNRMDLNPSQRKNGDLTQSAKMPPFMQVLISMRSLPWPYRCSALLNTRPARLTPNSLPHPRHLLTLPHRSIRITM
jgi:hypothetical protein